MRQALRRLFPRSDTHLLMARVSDAPVPDEVAGVRLVRIAAASEPGAALLEQFTVANGFPAGWVADMLGEGAVATALFDVGGERPVAMGWATARPFYVDEIGATLDPGGGVYLFGDFVAESHRGRRFQGLLVAERLRAEGAAARRACTIVHPSNVASVRSYERAGFGVAGRLARFRWRGRTWARCRPAAGGAVARFAIAAGDTIRAGWAS